MDKEKLEQENKLLKSFLYCTEKSCNNCGYVNCENFQRQRKNCCERWISFKDYIAELEQKKNEDINTMDKCVEYWTNKSELLEEKLIKAKEIIKTFLAIANNDVEYVQSPQNCKDLWKELCEKAEQFLSDRKED